MALEGWQSYIEAVAALTRASQRRARATALALLEQAGLDGLALDAGERAGRLTEEILATSRANRELLERLIATEVDRTAARLGFVRAEELDRLNGEIRSLRQDLLAMAETRAAEQAAARTSTPVAPAAQEAAREAEATKAAARKAAVPPRPRKTTSPRRGAPPAKTTAAGQAASAPDKTTAKEGVRKAVSAAPTPAAQDGPATL